MQAKGIWQDDEIDSAVIGLLVTCPVPWAVSEVERAIGNAIEARDSLARLVGGGLVHRLDEGFVFASRAARLASELPL